MRIKRLVSAIAALAMSASMFAGLATTASAETLPLTMDFNDVNPITVTSNTGSTTLQAILPSDGVKNNNVTFKPTAMTDDTNGKVLVLGSHVSGSAKYFGYDASFPVKGEGVITLSFDFEYTDTGSGKDHKIFLNFADSENTTLLKNQINIGTKKAKGVGINDTTTANTVSGKVYKMVCNLDFYNGKGSYSVLNADGSVLLKETEMALTAKNLAKLYLTNTDWCYGAVFMDNMVIDEMDCVDTIFTVTGLNNEIIADATLTVGTELATKTVTTDQNGQAVVSLPVGEYTYTVEKEGALATDTSTGTITITENDTEKSVSAQLSTEVKKVNVAINYYLKGSTDAVPTLSTYTIEKPVGDTIELGDLVLDDVRTDTDKYVYDSVSVELPYTVVSEENVINIYYAQVPKYTVNVVPSFDTAMILNSQTTISGDTMSYAYPKYIVSGNILYRLAEEKTIGSKVIGDGEPIVISYTVEDTGEYYFYEFDGTYTTRADYESMGSAQASPAEITVPADGVYTITANIYGNAGNRTGQITAAGKTVLENVSLSIYAPGTTLVAENIALLAGDKINVRGSDSKCATDYIILERTGEAANVTIDAPNASVFGITAGYIAQNTYNVTITPDLGYELTGVIVDGEAVTANEDGTYTIVVDGNTAVAVTTAALTDTWVFENLPLTEWLSSELFFTYNKPAEDGTVSSETTNGIVLENFLTDVAGVENVPTFSGEGKVNFAIVVLEDEEGYELTDIYLKKPEPSVIFMSGEFEADAEIDESEYLELGDMDFDIE